MRKMFGEILLREETCIYQHHISDYSNNVSAPVTAWCPGELIGWPASQ
jgi:hypothetical protein